MATEGEVLSRPFLGIVAAEPNWDAVYAEQLPRVYNFLRYRLGNDAHAEDLTSRTFEKAWAARARYRRDLAGFSPWLISIARNVATDHLRAQRPHLPLEAADEVAAKSTPHDDVANESDLARLGALLRQLPQREQELVALKYGAHAGGARVEGAQLHARNGDAEARALNWAHRLKRVFGIEIAQCALRCAPRSDRGGNRGDSTHMKHETKRLIAGAAVLASLIAPGLAAAQQLEIVDAWARATPTGVETAAAYLKIENIGDADRLVAARSPVSREVQIHDTVRNGLFMRMVRLDALELPAASVTEFAPGGRHLMFIGIAGPFIPGRAIELTLVFERSGERTVVVPVRDARSRRP